MLMLAELHLSLQDLIYPSSLKANAKGKIHAFKQEASLFAQPKTYLGINAAVRQPHEGAVFITYRTHYDICGLAHFFTGKIEKTKINSLITTTICTTICLD